MLRYVHNINCLILSIHLNALMLTYIYMHACMGYKMLNDEKKAVT